MTADSIKSILKRPSNFNGALKLDENLVKKNVTFNLDELQLNDKTSLTN